MKLILAAMLAVVALVLLALPPAMMDTLFEIVVFASLGLSVILALETGREYIAAPVLHDEDEHRDNAV